MSVRRSKNNCAQNEINRMKIQKYGGKLQDIEDGMKRLKMFLIGSSGEDNRENGQREIFIETIIQNIPELTKSVNTQIQKV